MKYIFKSISQWFSDHIVIKRIIVTLGFITLFKLGSLITVPGASVINEIESGGSFYGVLDMLGGGGLSQFSIFALGVTPYITSSIVIQLLSNDVIPYLSRLKKQGQKGQIKQERITRAATIGFAFMTGLAITLSFEQSGMIIFQGMFNSYWANIIMITLILTAGTVITTWIADKITMKGIGQGTSMIIFTGIVTSLPGQYNGTFQYLIGGASGHVLAQGIGMFSLFVTLSLGVIVVMAFFETSYRKIPIQQTGSGLNLIEERQTSLPIKTNPAGVTPVIFASAFITLIPMIAQFFPETSQVRDWVTTNFELTAPLGFSLYTVLILAFTFFYSHININAEETAENFQKSSTFIIGVKPGENTRQYISRVVTSMAFIGGILLTIIAITPFAMEMAGVPKVLTFGGTSSIIMISVAIDIWEQIKARKMSQDSKIRQIKEIKDTFKSTGKYEGKGIFG